MKDVHNYRAMADRCRELQRIAARDEVRDQLRQWAEDFDAEADELDNTADFTDSSAFDRHR